MALFKNSVYDALYQDVRLGEDVIGLINAPVIQRLRHVRLSNIDSIDMPGIGHISRYEHVIGVYHLATQTHLVSQIGGVDRIAVLGAALLHDWAITAFGHLFEEGLQYVGTGFHHENEIVEMVKQEAAGGPLGLDQQIIAGRSTGIGSWLDHLPSQYEKQKVLENIVSYINGRGKYGALIAGNIDLDNIDNVFRAAYHMGIDVDRRVPVRLVQSLIDISEDRQSLVFKPSAAADIQMWISVRKLVYEKFMLSRRDFAGKIMILHSIVEAFLAKDLTVLNWNFTDYELLQALSNSSVVTSRETVLRWLSGEIWNITPLYWLRGKRPEYKNLLEFSKDLSTEMGRKCFAYGIKDKRERALKIKLAGGETRLFGKDSFQWLLGVGSPQKKSFTKSEIEGITKFASNYFDTEITVSTDSVSGINQAQAELL